MHRPFLRIGKRGLCCGISLCLGVRQQCRALCGKTCAGLATSASAASALAWASLAASSVACVLA
jgi:hypothetical protein